MTTTDRVAIAQETATALRERGERAANMPVMLGFDGFVDSIIDVVSKRQDTSRYTPYETIEAFGRSIAAAAGQSSNYELVVKQRKLGGNGPIMANAMAAMGFGVTYIGTLGEPEIDPVFRELAERATVHSILAHGATDALEFTDGKLMLGKYDHLADVTYEQICERLGESRFTEIVAGARLIGMVNWTMLTRLGTIWDALAERVLPAARGRRNGDGDGAPPMIFIDLADPAKRTTDDLSRALHQIKALNEQAPVVLGMNVKEAGEVADAASIAIDKGDECELHLNAATLRDKLALHGVVIHGRRAAGAAMRCDTDDEQGKDANMQQATFTGPFVRKPYLSTGAGDNFNAGFCLGLLADLPLDHALCAGTATSGYYVRHGASPTRDQLARFCEKLPEPEA